MYPPGGFEPDTSSAPGPSYIPPRGRPWSPNEYEEDVVGSRSVHDYFVHDHIPGSILPVQRQSRREQNISSDSVEALDLADYARTLRRVTGDIDNPYPPFPHTSHLHPLSVPSPVYASRQQVTPPPAPYPGYPDYPPSPDNNRPFSAQSRDTFSQAPPSLVSGDTSHDTHDSQGSHHPYPSRRPYFLPSFLDSTSANHFRTRDPAFFSPSSDSPRQSVVQIASPVLEQDEVDISRFPAFSRSWYDDPRKTTMRKHTSLPPYLSDFQSDHADSYTHFSSAASNQSRNILPWSPQLSEPTRPPIDDTIKEERIQMLQHEFGKQEGSRNEDMSKRVIGSVDEKGALITAGPKRRISARWAQGILALAAAVSSLYGALFLKSPTPPPPASKPPAFALYGASVVTFLIILYLFALRPCCPGKRNKSDSATAPNIGGMMVLPVQGPPGGKNKKKKGKKGKHGSRGGDVQVNLIVDPGMFGGSGTGRDEGHDSERELDDFDGSPRREGGRGRGPQRRSVFQGLAMENDWKAARKFLIRMLFVDIACMIIWTGVFVLVLFGKRCPPGGFNGWCNSYNIASASACILGVVFGFSVFFDIMDLHMSKSSPRTRT